MNLPRFLCSRYKSSVIRYSHSFCIQAFPLTISYCLPCYLLVNYCHSFHLTRTRRVWAMHIEILHIQYKLRLVGNEVNGAQSNKDLIVQDFPASSMVVVPTVENHIAAGHGRITCSLNGVSVVFSELSSTYPLKLLSPRLAHSDVAIVYVMNYGGGLVCGDRIKLQVRAEGGSRLLLLSQVRRSLHEWCYLPSQTS